MHMNISSYTYVYELVYVYIDIYNIYYYIYIHIDILVCQHNLGDVIVKNVVNAECNTDQGIVHCKTKLLFKDHC